MSDPVRTHMYITMIYVDAAGSFCDTFGKVFSCFGNLYSAIDDDRVHLPHTLPIRQPIEKGRFSGKDERQRVLQGDVDRRALQLVVHCCCCIR